MQPPPKRSAKHEALDCFVGNWAAEGMSFGGTDQTGDPKARGEPWRSTHSAHWHTGSFFLFQDERAAIAGKPFDTVSVMGVDLETNDYFARTFENHGFYRDYKLERNGNIWILTGTNERARTEFADNGRKQIINWEWKPEDRWLPLCNRTAIRQH